MSVLAPYHLAVEKLPHPKDGTCDTLDMNGFGQTNDYSCGYAAIAMVIDAFTALPKDKRGMYEDIDAMTAKLEEAWHTLKPDEEFGSSTTSIIRTIRKLGMGVSAKDDLTFKSICQYISDGYPIITTVRTSIPDTDHWVVLYGVGEKPNRVYMAGTYFLSGATHRNLWPHFRRNWSPNGFGLLCWGYE